MKKNFKRIASSICLLMAFTSVGCGPTPTQSSDGGEHNKLYDIKVAVTNAGFGLEWAQELAKEYNEQNPDSEYGISIVDYGVKYADSILSDLKSGSEYQMYINSGNEITAGIYEDYFEDISDILDDKVDGESGPTIQEKISNFDTWENNYSKYGEGLYAMPYSSGVVGMVIDHQEFIDNGWYCFEDEAKTILTVGKDGKRGTYDDGQPQTFEEFKEMLNRISADAKPFIYGGAVASYLDYIMNAIFAQYAGVDEYSTFYNYDSNGQEVTLVGGEKAEITLDNGYKVYELESLNKAYETFEYLFDYTSGVANDYVHANCKDNSKSQYDTQSLFLLGYKGAATNPKSAIMIDGIWWENEATATFNSLDKQNRGKGDREYRMLLLPTFDGQKDTKSCVSVCTTGIMAIPKDSNAERLAVTKDFLKFLIKNESLRTITEMTGDILGYEYELEQSNKDAMTPFQVNMFEMYQDTDNIRIVQQRLDNTSSPLSYASDKGFNSVLYPQKSGVVAVSCLDAVKNYTTTEIAEGLKARYSQSTWERFISQAKNSGFFVD